MSENMKDMDEGYEDQDSDESIFLGFNPIQIKYCKHCNKFYHKGRYLGKKDFIKALPIIFKKNLELAFKPDELVIDESFLEDVVKNNEVKVKAIINTSKGKHEEEVLVPVKMMHVECMECSRMKGGYYEGTLQLRNDKNSSFKEILKEIIETVSAREHVAITKQDLVKNGADFYITDQKYMQSLVAMLHKKHGGEMKISRKLFSEDRMSSKKVYRVTVLLRLPDYNVGDVFLWNKELFKAQSFSSDVINAESLVSGKTRPIKMSEDLELVAEKKDYISVQVIKTYPNIEVLHPKTFDSVELMNKVEDVKKKINVVMYKNQLYAV